MLSKITYYLLVYPASHLPLFCLYIFSDVFYLVILTVFPYRRKVIRYNLKKSFPKKSPQELRKLELAYYRHFCDLLVEGIKNLSISERELRKRLVIKNPELMEELYDKKKNVLLVSGHYNNWEWLITSQNFLFPHQAMGIGMPLSSTFWDQKINEKRSRFGMKVMHAQNLKESITAEKDHPIAILVLGDQSPSDSRKSYWMDFLNQQTAVLFGVEQMAHEYDSPVVSFTIKKMKRGKYQMDLQTVTENPRLMKWGQITEEHTRRLEKEIIAHPQFWIWSHKRWKRELPKDLEQLKVQQQEKFYTKFSGEGNSSSRKLNN
jgi:Kdo2-lipid IVA lauroyltransferase/acyltransferase